MVGVVRWPSAGDTAGYRLRRPELTPVSLILILVPRAYCPQFRVHPQEGEGKGKGVDRRRDGERVSGKEKEGSLRETGRGESGAQARGKNRYRSGKDRGR